MNTTMKKLIAILLLAVLTISTLAGCGAAPAPVVPETAETIAAEEEAPAPVSPLEMVTLREEGTIPGDVKADYRLPKLDADSPLAEAFEAWVDSAFKTWKHNIDWNAEDNCCRLDYEVGMFYDILSVELTINGRNASFWPEASTFSIDLLKNEEVTMDTLLERANVTQEMMEDYLRRSLKEEIFDFEDSEYGKIRNIEACREETLSSENLKQALPRLSVQMDGTFQISIPLTYYVDTEGTAPTAKRYRIPNGCYVYLSSFSEIKGRMAVEDASEWIADGEKGKVEAYFPASYCMPKLISEEIDEAAFTEWADACLTEWKNNIAYRTAEEVSNNKGVKLTYRAFVIGDVLSVLLTEGKETTEGIWENNPSISFSLTTGKKMELKDMLEKSGFTKERLYAQLTKGFDNHWGWEDEYYGTIEGIEECRAAMITPENLDKSEFMLYPGEVDGYAAGAVTMRVMIPYCVYRINGIPTAELDEGYMCSNFIVPGLFIG